MLCEIVYKLSFKYRFQIGIGFNSVDHQYINYYEYFISNDSTIVVNSWRNLQSAVQEFFKERGFYLPQGWLETACSLQSTSTGDKNTFCMWINHKFHQEWLNPNIDDTLQTPFSRLMFICVIFVSKSLIVSIVQKNLSTYNLDKYALTAWLNPVRTGFFHPKLKEAYRFRTLTENSHSSAEADLPTRAQFWFELSRLQIEAQSRQPCTKTKLSN